MFKYYDQVPDTWIYKKLFSLWKGKGSELDLDMMRYIHGKDLDAKLLEALVGEFSSKLYSASVCGINTNILENHCLS